MSDQWNTGAGTADTSSPQYPSGDSRGERWLRRPRRSTGDRKIAGVAGGLGRAFGIDPVLIRVAFVVLTIFGGFGGLLYVLGWLLLPSDGDEVSAAEALLGRGRSSVPPPLAVGLGVIAVISAFSMFSWGLPFLPLAIGGVILLAILRKRGVLGAHGEWSGGNWRSGPHAGRWQSQGDWSNTGWTGRVDDQVRNWSEQAERWAAEARRSAGEFHGRRSGCGARNWSRWTGPAATSYPANSPFERPPFWERPAAGSRVDAPPPAGATPTPDSAADRVRMTKSAPTGRDATTDPAQNEPTFDMPTPRTTPPDWDPLGVAPFAWDLPEPTPLAQPTATVRTRTPGVIGRVTMSLTLLAGALSAVGVFAGWWTLAWAQVSGIALVVLAVGLLIAALRGRGYSLIGPGVFLSLVTLALAITGIRGTSGYGDVEFHPLTTAELQPEYTSNAGQLTLDLSAIKLESGDRTVTVTLGGGHAEVIVPKDLNVSATCEAGAGHSDCLGNEGNGFRDQTTATVAGHPGGTLHLNVKVNGGFAEVNTGA